MYTLAVIGACMIKTYMYIRSWMSDLDVAEYCKVASSLGTTVMPVWLHVAENFEEHVRVQSLL